MKTLYLSDLDGTLLRSDQRLSEYTCSVINRLVRQGTAFSFATARSRTTALKVTRGISVSLPMIAYNGAFIVDTVSGRILLKRTFSPFQSREIYSCFRRHGLSPIVYRLNGGRELYSYVPSEISPETAEFISSRGADPRSNPLPDDSTILDGEPFYFNCIGREELLRGAYNELKDSCEVLYYDDIYSGERWLELMPLGTSKASAALELKALLGCDRIAAFGDSVNDIPLFEIADEKYAVANAAPGLKALADRLLPSNDEDGVAHFLDQQFPV